jgi:hypothetical protein
MTPRHSRAKNKMTCKPFPSHVVHILPYALNFSLCLLAFFFLLGLFQFPVSPVKILLIPLLIVMSHGKPFCAMVELLLSYVIPMDCWLLVRALATVFWVWYKLYHFPPEIIILLRQTWSVFICFLCKGWLRVHQKPACMGWGSRSKSSRADTRIFMACDGWDCRAKAAPSMQRLKEHVHSSEQQWSLGLCPLQTSILTQSQSWQVNWKKQGGPSWRGLAGFFHDDSFVL